MRILFWFRKDLRLDDNTGARRGRARRGRRRRAVLRQRARDARRARTSRRRACGSCSTRWPTSTRACARAARALALAHGDAADDRGARGRARAERRRGVLERRVRAGAARARRRGRARAARRGRAREALPRPAAGPARRGARRRRGGPFTVYTPFRRACEALPLGAPLPAVTRLAPHDAARAAARDARAARLRGAGAARRGPAGARRAPRGSPLRRGTGDAAHGLARYATQRDLPGRAAPPRGCRPTSSSARSASARGRDATCARRPRGGPRAGARSARSSSPSCAGATSTRTCCGTSRTSSTARSAASTTRSRWEGDPRAVRRVARGPHRLPDRRRRHARAAGDRLHAQPRAHDRRVVPDQGPAARLAARASGTSCSHLVDGDLASNNGGWQWAAGTGTDAQPYFRIFNPVLQGERFDPAGAYVRRWVPELAGVPALGPPAVGGAAAGARGARRDAGRDLPAPGRRPRARSASGRWRCTAEACGRERAGALMTSLSADIRF